MLTLKQIKKNLEEDYSLKLISQAYTEISAVKLKNIREGIERNRKFFEEISAVFYKVKSSALKRNIKAKPKGRPTISILFTSNHRFYGKLETELLRYYITSTSKILTDRIIVGKTGIDSLRAMNYFHPYEQFVFWEDIPNSPELKSLSDLSNNYQKVVVYHSKFQSVLNQKPVGVDILQTAPQSSDKMNVDENEFDYIFEPEITGMLQFFESHITTLLLEQTFLEAELARTAARLVSMDQAQINADNLIKQQKRVLSQANKSRENLQLLEMIASYQSLMR